MQSQRKPQQDAAKPNPWPILLLSAVILLCVGGLLLPLPRGGRIIPSLGDMVHGPMFAVMTLLILLTWSHFRPLKTRAQFSIRTIVVASVMLGFGVGTEMVQDAVGRSASLHDVAADCAGILAAVCFFVAWQMHRGLMNAKKWIACLASAGIVLIGLTWQHPLASIYDAIMVRLEFPVLGSFGRQAELERWHFKKCTAKRVRWGDFRDRSLHPSSPLVAMPWHDHDWALQINFPAGKKSSRPVPSATLCSMVNDWSRFSVLVLDVTVDPVEWDPSDTFDVAVQIIDTHHGKGFRNICRTVFTVKPGVPVRLQIPREKWTTTLGRPLDVNNIQFLDVKPATFKAGTKATTIFLNTIRLVP